MNIYKTTILYFSPTGTTQKTMRNIAKGLGSREIEEIDLTPFEARWVKREFAADELVLLGSPVYSGRLPLVFAEIGRHLSGNNTPIVPVVVYGNREYDDALYELAELSKGCGFIPVAAGAFVAEHSFSAKIATGRPDAQDAAKQAAFGAQIMDKLYALINVDQLSELQIKGSLPQGPRSDAPISPKVNENCTKCGLCAEQCPMVAINPNDPTETDNFRCILCFRCVNNCPRGARYIDVEPLQNGIRMMELRLQTRLEPELFI